MKGTTVLRRALTAAGLVAVCAVAAASVVLRVAPRGNPAEAARKLGLDSNSWMDGSPVVTPRLPSPARGTLAPWRVGIQAGHWQIDQLPDELERRRGNTGAWWRGLTESTVNLAIARRAARQLQEAGVSAEVLPATVPPGYDADAFVAVHADSGGVSDSGWKISTPWRASEASRLLRDNIARTYGQASGLPEDRYGVSFNMRGYYGFRWYSFDHAAAPTTPAAIIETGFLTSAADRALIVSDPERAARGISLGVIAYLGSLSRLPAQARVPMAYPPMQVASDNAPLLYYPDSAERVRARLPAGTWVRPFDEEDGWIELVVWGNFRSFGWMRGTDLRPFTLLEQ